MDSRADQRPSYPLTIPDALLHSEAMQRACATRDFREIFRLVNRRTGSSYAVMAAAIGKITTGRVGDIIRGVRGVRGKELIERIADGFGIPGELLGVPKQAWELGAPSLSSGVSHASTPRALDLVSVAELRQQVQTLDARYSTEPSTALMADTGRHLGQLVHWQSSTTSYMVRRDLHAAMAEASTLMGQLVWDASGRTDHKTARTYFGQAVYAAQQLKDPVAEGLALLRTSFVALYGEKDASEGLALTQETAETVKDVSPVLSGLAVLHTAEAHAMMEERRECEKALSKAETYFGQVDDSDAGFAMLSPGQFSRVAGSCYLTLQDEARAQSVLEGTITEVRAGSKSHAIALGNLALTLIRQRKPDEAVGALGKAIDIVEGHRGGGGLNLIFQAGREIQTWRDITAVRELNDRLFMLIASA
ncbi:hypothetical protein SUDANB171_04817 [Streptomyces sp. enrichment culture]